MRPHVGTKMRRTLEPRCDRTLEPRCDRTLEPRCDRVVAVCDAAMHSRPLHVDYQSCCAFSFLYHAVFCVCLLESLSPNGDSGLLPFRSCSFNLTRVRLRKEMFCCGAGTSVGTSEKEVCRCVAIPLHHARKNRRLASLLDGNRCHAGNLWIAVQQFKIAVSIT